MEFAGEAEGEEGEEGENGDDQDNHKHASNALYLMAHSILSSEFPAIAPEAFQEWFSG